MPSHYGARASWRDQTSLQPPEVKVLPHERAPLRIRTRVLTLTRTLAPRANIQKSRRVPESAPFSFFFSEDGRMLVLRTPNTSLSNSHANTLVLRLATLTPSNRPKFQSCAR